MNPDEIKLESLSKNFEYEKLSREIDGCDSISELKNIAKCYAKIHLRYWFQSCYLPNVLM